MNEKGVHSTVLDQFSPSDLDVLIHTNGGHVASSYFLAQKIRSKCMNLSVIVPTYAYSGGTLISLAADEILMGVTSRLSPIDIQLGNTSTAMPLINFDKFVEFLNETANTFELTGIGKTEYLTRLMEKFVDKIPPFNIGEFYRMRTMQGHYAKVLLTNYMFRNDSNKNYIADHVVKKLTSDCPSHNFDIDLIIANTQIQLKANLMDEKIYKLGKQLINACVYNSRVGTICGHVGNDGFRMPYFELFKF